MDFLTTLCGFGNSKTTGKRQQGEERKSTSPEYVYPNLYEEADEMLQNALLIYTVTDLRTLAKEKKLNKPERILDLPLGLDTALLMIEDNVDLIQKEMCDEDHEMTRSALQSIQQRYEKHTGSKKWTDPWNENHIKPPYITKYGDEKPDTELVYAIGIDPVRKRVTVAFRGSCTPSDFVCDACITFSKRENPLKDVKGQENHIGIHHGFDTYLLKRHAVFGKSKYDEILKHIEELFQDKQRRKSYKLYCTGHSLGGALATLFAVEVAALLSQGDLAAIPSPVTCVSVASPRVGDCSFQKASRYLEQTHMLRHLRIANAGDPVTIMPKSSSKKLFAMLSPISYMTFKLQDRDFAERETYRHTGIKLKLNRERNDKALFELTYSGTTSAQEELQKDDEEAEEAGTKPKKKNELESIQLRTGRAQCLIPLWFYVHGAALEGKGRTEFSDIE